MKAKSRPKIGLMVETSRSYGRDLLRGVALFARTRVNWSLLHQEMTIDATVPEWMTASGLSGVIGRVDTHTIEALRSLKVPVVDVRCRRAYADIPQVETDDRAVARLAFEHLWERGFRKFAFCGYKHAHYSATRLRFFTEFVQRADCTLEIYETPGERDLPLTSIEQSGQVDAEELSQWLRDLSRPTGLFVCNDIRGQQVLNACRGIQLSVPDDVAVIGADNDDAICLMCDPPLSSIQHATEQVGFRAAEILYDMMSGSPAPSSPEYVSPIGVVQRLSTQVDAVEDREISRVCRFIREHACEGIDVNDVSETTSLSRRQLERRFRSELNRTIHEEITSAQISKVRQLLCETTMTLEQITPLAGYSHKERLSSVFKRETGQTPGEFRRDCR